VSMMEAYSLLIISVWLNESRRLTSTTLFQVEASIVRAREWT
jgi:hypothetical protein